MTLLYCFAALLAAVLLLWCLLLRPRRGQPGWEELAGYRYAHRGLHDKAAGVPENSLPAFRAAVEKGFGAELDLHLLRDGRLAVFHDSSLKRMCGADVVIEELTAQELKQYTLLDSGLPIPLFDEVLDVFEGETPLIVELKVVGGNTAALVDTAMKALEGRRVRFCVESFHPQVVGYLRKNYPQVLRGQLSENFLRRSGEVGALPLPQAAAMTWLLTTALTRPDFIAYSCLDRSAPALRLMRALYGVHEVSWTVRDRETLERVERDGCVPIFENFLP